jgi:hypothetical protein
VLKGCADSGVKRARVHILLDGRDVPDGSSVADTTELLKARRRAPTLLLHALLLFGSTPPRPAGGAQPLAPARTPRAARLPLGSLPLHFSALGAAQY